MKTITRTLAATVLTVFTLNSTSCQHQQKKKVAEEKNEVKAEAPDAKVKKQQGYALPGLDHGLIQSPINIHTNQTEDTSQHSITLNYKESSENVVNLGHTIQVNYDAGNTISFDGRTFDFKQFHFHTPSEHLIDGMTFPLEMHMVHTLPGIKKGEDPVYLVVGILFKEGKENPFLDEFMNAIPTEEEGENKVDGGTVNINDLKDQFTDLGYYHYQGSLTTPPYTETVTWLVIKEILEASPDQIQRFNKLEGNNARHVQAMYGRKVDGN
ncbi:carbonic anhydrase family protein [Allomuricauda sp. d1]|uniref:carbonic anhydrase n=1 Tax=Allomuricauda sp. d1 TaxID=3136725 RepID=UPI0031D7F857